MAQQLEDRRLLAAGPYSPAAGQPDSTAIAMDDPALVGWASGVADYAPGGEVDLQWQDTDKALGPAIGNSFDITSLGRGGQITLTFDAPIWNGIGPDFAVFENGISDTFLELGFVEVSSDGTNFVRFPNDSLTAGPVGAFGAVDPTNLDGLAGKYRQGFGTPFDLEQLVGVSPELNTAAITHVRLIDVVGDGTATDTSGDPIYDPYPTAGSAGLDVDAVGVLHKIEYVESTVGFEDVGANLSQESAWQGPDPQGAEVTGPYGGTTVLGGFESGGLRFNNAHSLDYGSWNQWAYSNQTDTTTAGFTNQNSVYAGQGAEGSSTYGVAFGDSQGIYAPPTIELAENDPRSFHSLSVTNTTYAALSMLQGDSFAKKFGGESGDDPDWFLLTIEGFDAEDQSVGTVDFYLADYRFEDNSLDYIVDQWTEVDVSSLSEARALAFTVSSSDVGPWGMNTPAYFAADHIVLRQAVVPLDLASDVLSESAGASATTGRVSRVSDDTSEPLEVTLAVSDASLAEVPASVIIPAGLTYVDFSIDILDDELFAGDRQFFLTASAEGLVEAEAEVTVVEDEVRALTVSLAEAEVSEGAGAAATTLTVSRNDADLSSPLVVNLASDDPESVTVPESVTIPAGAASVEAAVTVIDDAVTGGNRSVTLTAASSDYAGAEAVLQVIDDDAPQLSLALSAASIGEAAGAAALTGTVHRNSADLSEPLEVTLASSDTSETTVPASVTIPAGAASAEFLIDAVDDDWADGTQRVFIEATSEGFAPATAALDVLDNDRPRISITVSTDSVSESSAPPTASLEQLGRRLGPESFDNGSGGEGGFVSAGLEFNNTYNESFGVWGGWSYSNTTDVTTPGFINQYSAVAGGGAAGSDTYAVASAFAGSSAPTILRDPSEQGTFQSLMVTNTTYAALSMRDGDQFAKQFGGESGDDPDWFLLTIEGFDSQQRSVGTVDFYLADYRFEENSLDYIVDQWTVVDVSSLSDATELAFSLSSSDVGQFGMNTPAYFAIDNVVLAEETSAPTATVSRNTADLSEPLEVTLSSDDQSEILVPRRVTIPAGAASVDVPLTVYDDGLFDGDQRVSLHAQADGYESGETALTVVDDDLLELTISTSPGSLSENAAPPTAGLEDIGGRLGGESSYRGSDGAGGFISGPLEFSNGYDPQYGVWSGWAVSNTTDTTMAGFANQFSAYAGGGAYSSSTYAVANAYPGGATPTVEITDSVSSDGFDSIHVTNTTYAALSMLHGDSFAKKFGGESGNDPDWFLLTIEGFDGEDQSVGTVDFYLADYRFEDNSLDYIVDDWVKVDLSGLDGAQRLGFQLSSSDVGDYGMNTPAYFAADQIQLRSENAPAGRGVVYRNAADTSEPLMVNLSSDDMGELAVPQTVTIPAGQRRVSFPLRVFNDPFVDGDQSVGLTATASGYASAEQSFTVIDDDEPTLSLWASRLSVGEGAGAAAVEFTVHRNVIDLSEPLTVELASGDTDELILPASVTIPAGATSVTFTAETLDDVVADGPQSVAVSASAADYHAASLEVTVEDNDVAGLQVRESDGATVVSEAEGQDAFEVSLTAQPIGRVVVTATPSVEGGIAVGPSRLTFTPENWDQPQTITVTGILDLVLESDQQLDVQLKVEEAASDPAFAELALTSVSVTIEEYHPQRLILSQSDDSLVLIDSETGVVIAQAAQQDGLHVTADDRADTVTVEPMSDAAGEIRIETAGGDDTVKVRSDHFTWLDGGEGYDTLVLRGETSGDLAALLGQRVTGFEKVVLAGNSASPLVADAAALQAALEQEGDVLIEVASQEAVSLEGDWVLDEPQFVDSQFTQVVRAGGVTVNVVNDAPWQNVLQPVDVNGDGLVTPLDALIVINRLNRIAESALPDPSPSEPFGGNYYDVSGDRHITPLDALRVINHLNRASRQQAAAAGETLNRHGMSGEFNSVPSTAAVSPEVAVRDKAIRELFGDDSDAENTL